MRRLLSIAVLAAAGLGAQPTFTTPQPGSALQKGKPAVAAPASPGSKPGTAADTPAAGRAAGQTAAVSKAAPPPSVKDLKYPPLRLVSIPKVETFTLPNGLKLFLFEDHDLPTVAGVALVRAGTVFDPPEKAGLGDMTGVAIRAGGTKAKTGEQLDQQLESVAASVESDIAERSGTVSFTALKENADSVLGVFHDVLTAPEFRTDKLDLAKSQLRTAIARRNDDPARLALREFNAIVYGRDTAYGRRPEYATVDRITRADLQACYQRYFFPANTLLGVVGDFDTAVMKDKLEKRFADWTVQQPPVPEFPAVTAKPAPGTFLVSKRDVTQTYFTIGQIGGQFKDKDSPAMEILAGILGGGSQSRLKLRAATRREDPYEVAASWMAGYDRPGAFQLSGSTKSLSTADALKAIQEEAVRIRSSEVTEPELQTAKDAALGRLAFAFDSRDKALRQLLTYEYFHYPKDFVQQYQKALEAVTRADVLRAAKEHLDPQSLTIVAVGNAPDFGSKGLEALGNPVIPIDIRIAQPKLEAAKADAASLTKGKLILQRAQQAAGGADRLAAVKDYTQAADFHLSSGLEAKELDRWIAPTYFRQETDVPAGKIRVYYDGRTGWIAASQGSGPLAGAQLKQVEGDLFRVPYRLLLSDRDADRQVNAIEDHAVEISDNTGQVAQVFLDPQTGLVSRLRYETVTVTGPPSAVEEAWEDFREVQGLKVPYRIRITQNGQKFAEANVNGYEINSGLKLQDLQKRQ
jgi:zinc protease